MIATAPRRRRRPSRKSPARDARRRGARRAFKCGEARQRRSLRLLQPKPQFDTNAEAFPRGKAALDCNPASTKMRRLSSVNITLRCGVHLAGMHQPTMRKLIKIDY